MPSSFTRRAFLGSSLAACLPLVAKARSPHREAGDVKPGPGGWRLGIITDEITQDFGQALDFITQYKLHGCELRELWNSNIMNLNAASLDRARKLIEDHRLAGRDIGSPIFKRNLPQMPAKAEKRDTF